MGETLHPGTGSFCSICGAWRGSLGLEPTLSLYLDHMVEICREIRRVLRKDGTFWLNIGTSYAGSWGAQSREHAGKHAPNASALSANQIKAAARRESHTGSIRDIGLKPKDDMMIPSRLAIRLQEDGWWVRSEICWAKTSPMPESVQDRPTSATEKVFLLTRSAKYFYDGDAVREPQEEPDRVQTNSGVRYSKFGGGRIAKAFSSGDDHGYNPAGRAMRNFWLLGPEPFPEAHFATFPTEIPRRAILAGTSARGCCPKCGAGWERVTKTEGETTTAKRLGYSEKRGAGGKLVTNNLDYAGGHGSNARETTTIGWRPTCSCDACDDHPHESWGPFRPVPATVLDPFLGAGTTALVADRLGRHCIGIELSPAYARMAENRLRGDAGMFAEIAAE